MVHGSFFANLVRRIHLHYGVSAAGHGIERASTEGRDLDVQVHRTKRGGILVLGSTRGYRREPSGDSRREHDHRDDLLLHGGGGRLLRVESGTHGDDDLRVPERGHGERVNSLKLDERIVRLETNQVWFFRVLVVLTVLVLSLDVKSLL